MGSQVVQEAVGDPTKQEEREGSVLRGTFFKWSEFKDGFRLLL